MGADRGALAVAITKPSLTLLTKRKAFKDDKESLGQVAARGGGVVRWESPWGRCRRRGRTGERVRHGWSEPRYRRDPDSGGPRSARGSSRALGSLQGCGAQRSRSARSIALPPTPGVAQGCLRPQLLPPTPRAAHNPRSGAPLTGVG
ncbi:hypothetical protein MTO96_005176 [Rhipicephalus appendiculatus]